MLMRFPLCVLASIASDTKSVLCLVTQSCPALWDPMNCSWPASSVRGDSPGKITRVDCHALLQGIFPTQGSNSGLPHCKWVVYHPSQQGVIRNLHSILIFTVSKWYSFFLWLLLRYSYFVFKQFHSDVLDIVCFNFLVLIAQDCLVLYIYSFHHIWEFTSIFFQIFFPFTSPFRIPMTCMLGGLKFSESYLMSCFFLFSLCSILDSFYCSIFSFTNLSSAVSNL